MKDTTETPTFIGGRMRVAREALGLSQQEMAKAVGGSKRGIQDNEARNRVPGGEVIYGLVCLGINANWLLTGKGEMLMGKASPRSVQYQPNSHASAFSVQESGPSVAPPALINAEALAAIIYALIRSQSGTPDADVIAKAAAETYERYASAGIITPTGLNRKDHAA